MLKLKSIFSSTIRFIGFLHSVPILRRLKCLNMLLNFAIENAYQDKIVKVESFKFKIHDIKESIARKLILKGGWERQELKILCSLIKPGDTIIDVGANIGIYTVYMSRAVGPTGKVLAFEPDPINLSLLHENIQLNNCINVSVFPFALGRHNYTTKLYICDRNKGYQSFADLTNSKKSINVKVRRASDIIPNCYPSAMKIDVEGAEPDVWEGLKNKPKNMIFEFTPKQLRAVGNDPLVFLKRLLSESYKLFQIDRMNLIPINPESFVKIAEVTGFDYNILAKKQL